MKKLLLTFAVLTLVTLANCSSGPEQKSNVNLNQCAKGNTCYIEYEGNDNYTDFEITVGN